MNRSWLHNREQSKAMADDLRTLLKQQIRQASNQQVVRCACCDEPRMVRHLYKCFQCDLWFCRTCAPEHWPEAAKARAEDLAAVTAEASP